MQAAADDQVIVHSDAERGGCPDDILRDRDIRGRGHRVTGRMIVHQNEC